ncbi:MAG: NAD(P)-dependent oxidoreductase [Nitrososphaerota archaeon]|jgi:nucleoside-diphosphate-sugar epimerase|nr:NAD(P)-dependent oxidoreductase [Nitrososphaerota archaeon]MCL5672077.1 NAD(P)-dependent oxidoreductase [Nitrososphaerota archaeon]MDG6903644.1 NAD(P)-dependent oxidoreductase [Nitrososphaerota archaeon]MDG6911941.1 NAD(P)-dependent oxidoreductase [Nitrososphaerota archaeon]MDG6924493.1 NAD(P)-dependent oxidoreductase [Nitrososphaerota archaeon]
MAELRLTRVVVTGGSGKAGRACIRDLKEHGYEVFNVDKKKPAEELCPSIQADLADYGQAMDSLAAVERGPHGVDGVVHLAAIPDSRLFTNSVTFENNVMSTYNVFEASARLAIKNLVWASSETVLGLPFDIPPPYLPVDEEYAGRPESTYSLSKIMGERMAEQYCRWDPDLKIVALRFSNIMEPNDYEKFGAFQGDPNIRKWNLWGYIDARDAAQAVRRALEVKIKGAEVFIIANSDTVMAASDEELLASAFPQVPVKKSLGRNETLLSIDKARRMLGYEPEHSWRRQQS